MADEPPKNSHEFPLAKRENKRFTAWFDWQGNEKEQWYFKGSRTDRWFGSRWFHATAAVFFLILSMGLPLLLLLLSDSAQNALKWVSNHFCISFVWLAVTTLSLPLFIWFERLAFDDWVDVINDRREKKKLIARFELNTKHMEVFWKTVAGIYAAAGLFTLTQKADETSAAKSPTQEDIVALTKALNHVADVEAEKLHQSKFGSLGKTNEGMDKSANESSKTPHPNNGAISKQEEIGGGPKPTSATAPTPEPTK